MPHNVQLQPLAEYQEMNLGEMTIFEIALKLKEDPR